MRKLTMSCWLYTFLPCTNHLSISPVFLIDALLTFFGAERSLESSKNTALKVHYLSTASLPPLQKTSEITTTKWEHGTRWDKQLGSTAEHKWPEERGSSRQLRHRTAWTNHLLVKSLCRCPPCQYRQRQCHPAPCSPCWGSSQWASYCRQACGPPVWWPWSPPSFARGRSCRSLARSSGTHRSSRSADSSGTTGGSWSPGWLSAARKYPNDWGECRNFVCVFVFIKKFRVKNNYLLRVCNKNPGQKMPALHWNSDKIRYGILYAENPLHENQRHKLSGTRWNIKLHKFIRTSDCCVTLWVNLQ